MLQIADCFRNIRSDKRDVGFLCWNVEGAFEIAVVEIDCIEITEHKARIIEIRSGKGTIGKVRAIEVCLDKFGIFKTAIEEI
jgi:hypothetical protein